MIFSELGILESITPPEAGMGEPEMDLSNQEYDALVRSKAKPSPLWKDLAWAFCVGGGICVVGQGLMESLLHVLNFISGEKMYCISLLA